MSKFDFVVAKDGFLDGVHRAAGETIRLTEKQAEHLLISGQIERPKPAASGDEAAATEASGEPVKVDEPAQTEEAGAAADAVDDQPARSRRR